MQSKYCSSSPPLIRQYLSVKNNVLFIIHNFVLSKLCEDINRTIPFLIISILYIPWKSSSVAVLNDCNM